MNFFAFKRLVRLSVCGLSLAGTLAHASDFSYRSALNRTSLASGFNRASAPLLTRQAGAGARTVADSLVRSLVDGSGNLNTRGGFTVEEKANRLRYVGANGWDLRVYHDGTAVSYRNLAYLSGPNNAPRPSSERLSNERLEALGRSVITQLSGFLPLASNETLVPFFSEHRLDRGNAVGETAPATEEVTASSVIFSRTIDGSAIVGGGSKIAIHFANDGTPVGFDFDWPTYAQQRTQVSVLPVDSVHKRASQLLAADPFDTNSKLKRFECGYVDVGARRNDPKASVQPGCFYFVRTQRVGDAALNRVDPNDGLEIGGIAEPVPAGSTVTYDARWAEAALLCTNDTRCGTVPRGPPAPSDPK